jgi:hypothetical protein
MVLRRPAVSGTLYYMERPQPPAEAEVGKEQAMQKKEEVW